MKMVVGRLIWAHHQRSTITEKDNYLGRFLLGFLQHQLHDLQEHDARVAESYHQAIGSREKMEEGRHYWLGVCLRESCLNVGRSHQGLHIFQHVSRNSAFGG